MRFHALGSFAVFEQSERRLPPLRSVLAFDKIHINMKTKTEHIHKPLSGGCALLLLCCFTLVFAAGCATIGRDFPSERLETFKIGVTSKDDLMSVLGKPKKITKNANAEEWEYTYAFYKSAFPNPFNGSTNYSKNVTFKFFDGVLQEFNQGYFGWSSHPDGKGCAWGKQFDQAAMSALVVGKTTPDDVLARFGQPNGQANRHDGKITSLIYAYSHSENGAMMAVLLFQEGLLWTNVISGDLSAPKALEIH